MSINSLFNIEFEQIVIGAILQKVENYIEISAILTPNDFSKTYAPIFQIIQHTIENKGIPTPAIIAEKCKSIGISFDGIEIYDYLMSLMQSPIDHKGITQIATELKKLKFVRTLYDNAGKIQKEVIESKHDNVTKLVNIADKYLGNSILLLNSDSDDSVNLDEGIPDLIEERGNNPQDVVGYKLPFNLFENYFGGLTKGDVGFIGARTGAGKSTFLMYLMDKVINECNPDKDIKGLYLDTEMDEDKQRLRLVASRLGVPYYLINSGNWRKDTVWFPKIREEMQKMRTQKKNNLWFKQAHNLTGKDLESFIKKWYYNKVGRGNDAFVILDYLKPLAADMFGGNVPEWQVVYQKMQMIKDIALDLGIPVWTAIQLTTAATTKGKSIGEVDDSENSLSMSKRLDWLVSFSGILRKKLPDEMSYHGPQFGTHMLIPHKHREEGKFATGHHNLVKIFEKGKPRYMDNFLCFNIDNFKVEEVADLKQIAESNGWNKIKIEGKAQQKQDLL